MRVLLNGLQMSFEEAGRGAPLLLLHGYPLHRKMWQAQVEALRAQYRVITPDVRGFGESEAAPGVYSMDLLADDMAALLQYLQCGPAIIAGHSMGGYILFAFLRKYPELVRGLILVSTRAVAHTAEGKANREALAQRIEQEGHRPVVEKMLAPMMAAASVAANPSLQSEVESMMCSASLQGLAGASRGMAARRDAGDLLSKINVPTLILSGTADALIPHAESEKMAQAIPNAKLHSIEGAGHLLSMERPQEVNQALKEWLPVVAT